jgi:hypothetical protein
MLIVEAATSRRYHGLGGAPSSGDPGHHLGEVRAVGEDRCTLDDLASGPVRACKASHQCADYFVFHTSRLLRSRLPDLTARLPIRRVATGIAQTSLLAIVELEAATAIFSA